MRKIICAALLITLAWSVPVFPNVGYLGQGYNIIYGNPKASGTSDPGFLVQEILQLTFVEHLTTSDGRYSIPDNTSFVLADACSVDLDSSEVYGDTSYYKSLTEDAKVDASFPMGAFQMSADYQYISQQAQQHSSVTVITEAVCSVYRGAIDTFAPPPLTQDFQNAVASLTADYDEGVYGRVVEAFGTHVATTLTMGGRFGVYSTFTNTSWETLQTQSVSVSVSAKFSAVVASGQGSSLTTDQQRQASSFTNLTSRQTQTTLGGQYTTILQTWIDSVSGNPMPISYELTNLTNFLTEQYFPNDVNITLKQANMQMYLMNYCKNLLPSCGNAPDPPPMPPVMLRQFGGIYEVNQFGNPLTGTDSCPDATYEAFSVLAKGVSFEQPVFMCLRKTLDVAAAIYYGYAGGFWNSTNAAYNLVNPYTNDLTCPENTVTTLASYSGRAYRYECLNYTQTSDIGGFFANPGEMCSDLPHIPNSITMTQNCPDGFKAVASNVMALNPKYNQFTCLVNYMCLADRLFPS